MAASDRGRLVRRPHEVLGKSLSEGSLEESFIARAPEPVRGANTFRSRIVTDVIGGKRRVVRAPSMRVSMALGCQLNGWGHEFRTHGVNNCLRKDPIYLGHGGRVDMPAPEARDWCELFRPARAPERNR
jgi:hypothetical protein